MAIRKNWFEPVSPTKKDWTEIITGLFHKEFLSMTEDSGSTRSGKMGKMDKQSIYKALKLSLRMTVILCALIKHELYECLKLILDTIKESLELLTVS